MSVTDEAAASAGLLPLVVAAGVRLAAFERVRPSLEDVFLRLVGRDAGWRRPPHDRLSVLLRKELLESWRTLRLPIVAGLFLLVGLTSPLLAKFLPEIIEAAAGDQLPPIPIPTPVAADAADQLWKNLAQFGAIAAIVLAMGAVATERDRGTAAFVLSKTARARRVPRRQGRGDRAGPRPACVLAVAVGWVYTAILFEPPAARRLGRARRCSRWLGAVAWAALTFAGEHDHRLDRGGGRDRLRRPAGPVDRRRDPDGRPVPAGRAGRAGPRPGGRGCRSTPADVLAPVAGTLAIVVVALAASIWSFRRQEL